MLRAARFIAGYGLEPDARAGRRGRGDAPTGSAIVSAERIRDELDKLIVVDDPAAGLWFLVDTGLADEFLPELPAMRLEQDPIHRHKDVLAHTIAVVENVRRRRRADVRLPRHPAGRAVPRRRQAARPAATGGQGRDVPPPRGGRGPHDPRAACRRCATRNDDVDAVSRAGRTCTCASTPTRWAGPTRRCAATSATPATLLDELNELTRCDCTTRNERKAAQLSRRMDELEARIAELRGARRSCAAIRPELDGNAGDGAPRRRPRAGRRRGAGASCSRSASTRARSATTRRCAASTSGGRRAPAVRPRRR